MSRPAAPSGYGPPLGPQAGQEAAPPEDDGRWWVNDRPVSAPLSYDEASAEVPDDPDPARLPGSSLPGEPPPITRATVRDIEGKMAFWLSTPIEFWMMVDPYCAGVAADNVDKVAKKAAPLICQSPQLVHWFGKATGFMLWTELGMSIKPILVAVIAHHVTKSIETKKDAGGQEQAQHADWSMYSAA
jgi:hypothetical protein